MKIQSPYACIYLSREGRKKHFDTCLKVTVEMLTLLDVWWLFSLCFPSIVWNCSMELTACDMQNRRIVWSHRIALLFLRPLCATEPWVLPVPKPVSPTLVCLPSYLVTFCWFLMQYSEFSNFLKFVPSRNAIRCPVSPENENRFYLDVCIEIGI